VIKLSKTAFSSEKSTNIYSTKVVFERLTIVRPTLVDNKAT
jgi:hypothetical protein